MGVDGDIVILAICENHFINVYENLVQHPGNNMSIVRSLLCFDALTILSFILNVYSLPLIIILA